MKTRKDHPAAAFLFLAVLIALAPHQVHAAGVRETHRNLVGGEILGRGFALTVNYERFLNNHVGIGGGLMAVGSSDGVVGIAPMYVSFLPGDMHSLYLSVGGAIVGGSGDLHDYSSAWVLQGSVGYQFQSESGFFIRPLFTINQAATGSGGFLVWPGMTIGGSF